ncbi:hypothetical protein OAF54_03260, partial [bacterium]|nr:hypothetical protein [bacterium]
LGKNTFPLISITDLTTVGGEIIYTSGPGTYATSGITATGRTVINQPNLASLQSYLEVVRGVNVQAYDDGLQSIAGLTTVADKILYTTASDTYATTDLTSYVRTNLLTANNASELAAATGLLAGAGSSTDTAIAKWSGTGGDTLLDTGILITATNELNMGSKKIINLLDPTSAQDAASKAYVDSETINQPGSSTDTAIVKWSGTSGDTVVNSGILISGINELNMGNNKIINLATPTLSTDAITKAYVDDGFLPQLGGASTDTAIVKWSGVGGDTVANSGLLITGSNELNMGSNKIINLLDPTNPQDAATKAYADSLTGITTPGSTTLNNIVRWGDITGDSLLNTGITIDNSDNITGVNSLNNVTSTELSQLETIGATVISADNWAKLTSLNQDLGTTDDVTFNSLTTTTTLSVTTSASISGGTLNMNSNKIVSLGAPTAGTDAATKAYVDSVAGGAGLTPLDQAEAATTTNLTDTTYVGAAVGTLTSNSNGAIGTLIDGATLTANATESSASRVLVKDQTDPRENGVYYLSDAGSAGTPWILTRSDDFKGGTSISQGTTVFVNSGTANAATTWIIQTAATVDNNDIDPGDTSEDIVWVLFTSGLTAGTGLSVSGGAYNVNTVGTAGNIYINGSDQVDINGALAIAKGGTNATSYTADRILAFNSGGTAFETTTLQPSQVVTLSGSQSLTSKTLDATSNTITADALHDKVGGKVSINNTATTLNQLLAVTNTVPLQAEWTDMATVSESLTNKTLDSTSNTVSADAIYHKAGAGAKVVIGNSPSGGDLSLVSTSTTTAEWKSTKDLTESLTNKTIDSTSNTVTADYIRENGGATKVEVKNTASANEEALLITNFSSTPKEAQWTNLSTLPQTLTFKTIDNANNTVTANHLRDSDNNKITTNNAVTATGQVLAISNLAPLQAEWSVLPTDINGLTAETSADNADEIVIYDNTAGANRKMSRANFLTGVTATLPSGVVNVAASGGDFTTITAALASFGGGSGTVFVYPGTYLETITIAAGQRVIGVIGQACIIANTGTSSTVTMTSAANNSSTIKFMGIAGPVSGTNPIIDVQLAGATEGAVISNCFAVTSGGTGPDIKMTNGGLFINGAFSHGGTAASTASSILEITGGDVIIQGMTLNSGAVGDVINMSGGECTGVNVLLNNSSNCSCTNVYNISGGVLKIDGTVIPDATPASTGLNITADGVTVSLSSAHLKTTGNDIIIGGGLTGTGSKISVIGKASHERTSIPSSYTNGILTLNYSDDGKDDDPGYRIVGDSVSFGTTETPTETIFGEGDSTTKNMKILSAVSGASFIEHTVDATSSSGSTFAIWQGTGAGNEFYIGNTTPRQFYGFKSDITIALSVGTAVIVPEYWNGAWTSVATFSSGSSFPYTAYGAGYASSPGGMQTRFDYDQMVADWLTTSVNGQSAYWIRFRIDSGTLTTIPVLERIKLHTNRTEINNDGMVEYFGQSQPKVELIKSEKLDISASGGFTTATQDFNIGDGIIVTQNYALFQDNKERGFGYTV